MEDLIDHVIMSQVGSSNFSSTEKLNVYRKPSYSFAILSRSTRERL